ncbi:hypothetical protein [Mycolicibacterium brumae]|uniref:Lipoprotein n=1 Tax=Mycolicibacterium brumae TaxID=85968 RepID=A0A2G5P528_9MYCO|nr:hypothetical protein [Mycolicibacterium brumae]MCV7194686.1 hypothetical protein [Mycolicibacterium brumae]PIB73479.1 hypothetical protein CQY22_016685 [Mycolicibacterium brumae]RWA15211.1 hypothetical protein MBRU_11375 [Mycolicibacterium brumae DSM 44177]UWW08280.1 hypothetical protein L2Z93_001328 [Mycolicibacterium brumae]
MIDGGRIRTGGRLIGGAAAVLIGVIGCSAITDGEGVANQEEAPAFRTSVSVSASAAEVTSSAKAAERAAAETTKAIYGVCETMATSSADAVSKVNTYVSAVNGNGDPAVSKQPAVDALNNSADNVETGVTAAVTGDLGDALTAWVAAARATADSIANDASPTDFNASVMQVNSARKTALELCDSTYR